MLQAGRRSRNLCVEMWPCISECPKERLRPTDQPLCSLGRHVALLRPSEQCSGASSRFAARQLAMRPYAIWSPAERVAIYCDEQGLAEHVPEHTTDPL